MAEQWNPEYGDRINKLVFIGIDMDRARLISSLDACLLTEEEMKRDWRLFPDNLPNAAIDSSDAASPS
ncbi:hypothetical protein PACILC2_01180 [Paenibacillus cisolokensis]|uniref:CobW C-terminal domain-containing protein n=1 Tax=Paenibacillus cisolokensis TaxID=1658519 RepID=A0ABQ4N042_9BACL|nr:hypothetical protein PACILC2_01180 [Paenibacillus cisolokensis]